MSQDEQMYKEVQDILDSDAVDKKMLVEFILLQIEEGTLHAGAVRRYLEKETGI